MHRVVILSGKLVRSLLSDRGGNTLALVAAAMFPLLALIGGAVDMSRSYLAQSRLQQACDSGVLAARKMLDSEVLVTGNVPKETATIGERFFNANFEDGAYGTDKLKFQMYLEPDYSISGQARVAVPTTIMGIFGHAQVDIAVDCEAQVNFPDTDVMMVLDVTGSMAQTNPGESTSRISVLKDTLRHFYAQLTEAAKAGSRVRYGFVPYSTNVNVGHLLKDSWMVSDWHYQSRKYQAPAPNSTTTSYSATSPVSGSVGTSEINNYTPSSDYRGNQWCPTKPANTVSTSYRETGYKVESGKGPPPYTRTVRTYQRTRNGSTYSVSLLDNLCRVYDTRYSNYIDTYDQIVLTLGAKWKYDQITYDVSDWRDETIGCIEERSTYQITDYDNVDLTRALDLDLDLEPTSGEPDTQWRPMYPDYIYGRRMKWDNTGDFDPKSVVTTDEYVSPVTLGTDACPAPAQGLEEMSKAEFDTYVDTLKPDGSTYHDIGMIWGGRLVSPTGIFANQAADPDGSKSDRHLIFLTDGETSSLDLSYTSYGFEPLDRRRWQPGAPYSLTQTVEKRFSFACNEVKKRNVTVWVVGFGVDLNSIMKDCAGDGKWFEAADSAELNSAFATIATRMSELRITK